MKVMIHRQILKDIEEWSKRPNRKPLVLRGARQVGKTTLVDEFGKQFDIYIKLNLEQSADAAIFGMTDDVNSVLQYLSLQNNVQMDSGKGCCFSLMKSRMNPKLLDCCVIFMSSCLGCTL